MGKIFYIIFQIIRNADSAYAMKQAFKFGWARKTYLCLAKGWPQMNEGVIDFGLKETLVEGKYKVGCIFVFLRFYF